ncbi:MAG: hypothetical protein JSS94_07900 [Bacteroidetes bacterium]|nr:hypothetical protein [Bacteroidota bacterium]
MDKQLPNLSGMLPDTFGNDFRAEIIAAELINQQLPEDKVLIFHLGPKKRNYSKDVDEVVEDISDYNRKEYTFIRSHKEGIYDMLPEGLFHSPVIPKSAISQKEIIQHIKRHKIEERNARRFFMPFESGIDSLRIQMALYETRIHQEGRHNELIQVFKPFWDIFKYLDNEQSNIFLKVIPLIHEVRDDYEAASSIFELLLGVPVKISSCRQAPVLNDNFENSKLDNCFLGIDSTTGNQAFDGGEEDIIIEIGPLNNTQMQSFRKGMRNDSVLQMLSDYLLPVHLETKVMFIPDTASKVGCLADETHEFNAVLGVDVYL